MKRLAGVAPRQSLNSSSIAPPSRKPNRDDTQIGGYAFGARAFRRRLTSKNTERDAGSQCAPKIPALPKLLFGYAFCPQNLFRGLRVSADDDGVRDRLQAPAGRNTFDLLRRIAAIAAGADQRGIWPAVDAIERGIVRAVEKILHLSRHRGEILRSCEYEAVGVQHVARLRVGGTQQ